MKHTLLLLGCGSMGIVLAELGPLPELSNVTSTGLLGWYAWHTVSRTIPSLVADFRTELAAKRGEARAEREAFRKELSEERMQRHADQLQVVQALQELSAELRRSERLEPVAHV